MDIKQKYPPAYVDPELVKIAQEMSEKNEWNYVVLHTVEDGVSNAYGMIVKNDVLAELKEAVVSGVEREYNCIDTYWGTFYVKWKHVEGIDIKLSTFNSLFAALAMHRKWERKNLELI